MNIEKVRKGSQTVGAICVAGLVLVSVVVIWTGLTVFLGKLAASFAVIGGAALIVYKTSKPLKLKP